MARRNYDAAPIPGKRYATERQIIDPLFGKPSERKRTLSPGKRLKQTITYRPTNGRGRRG